jgi:hypothetical protein
MFRILSCGGGSQLYSSARFKTVELREADREALIGSRLAKVSYACAEMLSIVRQVGETRISQSGCKLKATSKPLKGMSFASITVKKEVQYEFKSLADQNRETNPGIFFTVRYRYGVKCDDAGAVSG